MMNIQFVVKDKTVYVIEVNPRASRTVPFMSKVTGIPMAQVATKLILGSSLKELGYEDGLYQKSSLVHVKAPIFSFNKLSKVDSLLGPEMKSTGEVIGSDSSLEKALYKAFEASYMHVPDFGNIIFTISDDKKAESLRLAKGFSALGYRIFATSGTSDYFLQHQLKTQKIHKIGEQSDHILELMKSGKIQAVINTDSKNGMMNRDGQLIRSIANEQGIPLFTSLDTAKAMLRVLESRSFSIQSL